MNDKTSYLNQVIDIVVSCCITQLDKNVNFTRRDLVGPSKAQNLVMTRCILAVVLKGDGFSVETIAFVLNRTPHTIRKCFAADNDYKLTSKAYQIAFAQAVLQCKAIQV